jgi:FkbM family methyltransferase
LLNDRSLWLIARNVARWSNYYALARVNRVYEHPLAAASRYLLGGGEYPCPVRVRTPTGPQAVTLFNSQDAVTVHEIFCREDYKCPSPPRVIVDLGSNIGVSALYFLTRSPSAYCELYEPDPRNVPKLLLNLQAFSDRFTLHETAVADREGVLPFSREPTGRYGRLNLKADVPHAVPGTLKDQAQTQESGTIKVRVEHINTVLSQAIARHGTIDLLKVDTEGTELATVRAIDPAIRSHIRRIVIEWFDRDVQLDGFTVSSSCDTITFTSASLPEN